MEIRYNMKTLDEILAYYKENFTGGNPIGRDAQLIIDTLSQSEDIKLCFPSILNYKSLKDNDGVCTVAVTDTRFMIVQSGRLKKKGGIFKNFGPRTESEVESIPLDMISDVSVKTVGRGIFFNGVWGFLTVITMKDQYLLAVPNQKAQEIYGNIQNIISESKKPKSNIIYTQNISSQNSADEILKFKQLLDAGVITQEEFEINKKQLLGI